MGDMEEDEDFEAFEMRQKAEQTMGDHAQESFDKNKQTLDTMGADDLERELEYDDEEEGEYEQEEELADLTKTKLSEKDYMKRAQSAKAARKGKYGVTVPKPFGFDTRDRAKPKTIREHKVDEMVREKKQKEEQAVGYQFRSKPIPPSVLIPRYQSIQEADLARRNAVRSHSMTITAQKEKPFTFWEREKARKEKRKQEIEEHQKRESFIPEFKANPIPRACSVLIFDKKIKQEELIREKRIKKAAEISFAKAAMPPTMQKWADAKKSQGPKKPEVEYTFMPDIGPNVTAKMLQDKAERFQRELAKKKGQKTQTKPQSPNFIKRPQKLLDRSSMNEGSNLTQEDKYTAHMRKLAESAKAMEATQQTNPSSTKAVTMGQMKRREEILSKRKKEEEAKKEDEERIKKQQAIKGTVQGALKQKFGKSSDKIIREKVKDSREAMRKQEIGNKKALEDAVKKGRSRPMLLETSTADYKANSNLSMLKATYKMIELLKAQGEKPDQYLTDE